MVAEVLVGLAHGSRHPEVPASVADLMTAVAEIGGPGVRTESAFLDLTEPDLTAVATSLAADGIRSATVVPLLFTHAFHASVDVPEAVAGASAASGLSLTVADILGTDDDLVDVLEAALQRPRPAARRVLLFAVGSSDEAANAAVEDLGRRLGQRRGVPVEVGFGTREPRGTDRLAVLAPGDVVLPLFTSPGLLLDPMAAACAERGVTLLPPLGRLLAPLVLRRSRSASAPRTVG